VIVLARQGRLQERRIAGELVGVARARAVAAVDDVIHHGGAVYRRPQLFANRLAFRYRSVLHEFLDIPPSSPARAASRSAASRANLSASRERAPSPP
jgi:hypothetical protein